jgi:Fe-S cluster assembly iron-binding protein IscA
MIAVTRRARERLEACLAANAVEPGLSLRLEAAAGGALGLVPGRKRDGDHAVVHEGRVVLLVGFPLSLLLDGLTLDCEQTGNGARLSLRGAPH